MGCFTKGACPQASLQGYLSALRSPKPLRFTHGLLGRSAVDQMAAKTQPQDLASGQAIQGLSRFAEENVRESCHWTVFGMCSLERTGSILVLRLTGETEHRFSPSLCSQIRQHLAFAAASDARALVTTNDGKFFSNGLDLEWTKQEPETRVPFVLRELERLVLDLLKLNMPTYAAICGHAAAGGLLFAMAHDHRIMRKDRGFLYSSAVDINFVLPPGSVALMRAKVTPKVFKDMVLQGVKYTGIMAHEAGLVDSLQEDSSSTFLETLKEAAKFADRPWEKPAYLGLRLAMYPELVEKLERESSSGGFLTV